MKKPNPLRAEVIEKSINIEWIMNAVISQHYLKRVSQSFILEFLYDEYCSFALKRRVLLKICPDLEKGEFSQQLGRINTIRNYFAHCSQIMGEIKTGKEGVPDPKKTTKFLDFDALHAEFLSLEKPVLAALITHFKKIGGLFIDSKTGELTSEPT